jgi:hypothetical protein
LGLKFSCPRSVLENDYYPHKNDFDVNEWAAPEFLEAAARELVEGAFTKTKE